MKKLLSLLGAVAFSGTGTLTLAGCSHTNEAPKSDRYDLGTVHVNDVTFIGKEGDTIQNAFDSKIKAQVASFIPGAYQLDVDYKVVFELPLQTPISNTTINYQLEAVSDKITGISKNSATLKIANDQIIGTLIAEQAAMDKITIGIYAHPTSIDAYKDIIQKITYDTIKGFLSASVARLVDSSKFSLDTNQKIFVTNDDKQEVNLDYFSTAGTKTAFLEFNYGQQTHLFLKFSANCATIPAEYNFSDHKIMDSMFLAITGDDYALVKNYKVLAILDLTIPKKYKLETDFNLIMTVDGKPVNDSDKIKVGTTITCTINAISSIVSGSTSFQVNVVAESYQELIHGLVMMSESYPLNISINKHNKMIDGYLDIAQYMGADRVGSYLDNNLRSYYDPGKFSLYDVEQIFNDTAETKLPDNAFANAGNVLGYIKVVYLDKDFFLKINVNAS